ncbi:dihydroxyacetone kinase subunit DhaL [Mycoplasma procyoni]|uniref:dihydroxyacetone kinase subunit DhaL n=1 Tax=Mycoplasma procyoni TaxID=568784 RepID=UPI00197B8C81|nr:dihydroxyacetone kinase subunit DhaL [Mycoplasma procyoni]MBN3534818.1 dihydroxyacetone kinase subunit L [Mycoplasma procyoni]
MKIDVKVVEAFKKIASEIQENESLLSGLDQKIGDGDHGINMNRGFSELMQNDLSEQSDLFSLFSLVGRTLMSKVGGASGPLYGMAFINSANNLKEHTTFSLEELKIMAKAFSSSLEMLGKVSLNEKTMYDIWKPLSTFLENINEVNEQTKKEIKDFVEQKLKDTEQMIATKGRASYLKERSQGTIDPGSYSSSIIIKNLVDIF